jgi:hypothetical protein
MRKDVSEGFLCKAAAKNTQALKEEIELKDKQNFLKMVFFLLLLHKENYELGNWWCLVIILYILLHAFKFVPNFYKN